MNGVAVADPPLLPNAALALLRAFEREHAGVYLRLSRGSGEDRIPVYPRGSEASEAPDRVHRQEIESSSESTLVLTVGDEVAEASVRFLAAALEQVFGQEREARLAARELTERYEEINLLYSISEILGSVLSLQEAASRILTEVADVLGARRAALWVHEAGGDVLKLIAQVGEEGLRSPVATDDPNSVTARVFRECQAINLERGTVLPRGTRIESRPQGREAFLSVPINYTPPEGGGRTVGVITLVGGRANERFSAGDARLLSAIASQIGAALETHRLMRESLRQERVVRELELAHDLQLKLLPEASEFDGTADVAARCAPADSVGGDFYHLFRLPGDRLGVMIGDVSGHGFSAALIMALTMSAVAISAQEAGPPGAVLRRVHRALSEELATTEMYVSLFYGVIDASNGTLVYANAGHPHAFCVRASGETERLGATNPPLGMIPLDQYGEATLPWETGVDLLCLFTDGLSDAFAMNGGASGEAVLLEDVSRLRDAAPHTILEHLFAAAAGAELGVPPDDRTAVLVRA